MSSVLLTGATGHLGSMVLPRLIGSGHEVRALSRSTRPDAGDGSPPRGVMCVGDLADGTGIPEAVAGVDVVVHCASDPRHPKSDISGATHLIRALLESGSQAHLVYISIVGVDALPWTYYRAKHRVEQAVETSGLPWTVQRATQFHSFVDTMVTQLARSPIMVVPHGFEFQPVATSEVADLLAEHVDRGPAGRAPDLGGPEILPASELARSWLEAHGRRRPLVRVPLPGKLSRSFRSGANLCPAGTRGHATWQQHLTTTVPIPSPEAVDGTARAPGVLR